MAFWKKHTRKSQTPPPDTGTIQAARKTRRRTPPVAIEVKLLAIVTIENGADRDDLAEVIGELGEASGNEDSGQTGGQPHASSLEQRRD